MNIEYAKSNICMAIGMIEGTKGTATAQAVELQRPGLVEKEPAPKIDLLVGSLQGKCRQCGKPVSLGKDGCCNNGHEICYDCWNMADHNCPVCLLRFTPAPAHTTCVGCHNDGDGCGECYPWYYHREEAVERKNWTPAAAPAPLDKGLCSSCQDEKVCPASTRNTITCGGYLCNGNKQPTPATEGK